MKSGLKSALSNLNEERGMVFPVVLILLLLGALLMAPLLHLVGSGIVSGSTYQDESRELYAADAGVMDALWVIGHFEDTDGFIAGYEGYGLELVDEGKYHGALLDPVNSKSVQYVIEIDGDRYIITSTAIAPDGSSTTIEVLVKNPDPLQAPVLYAAASIEDELKIGGDLGHGAGTSTEEDVGTGDGETRVFDLDYYPVEEGSETVTVDSAGQDYTINYTEGQITFVTPPPDGAAIVASYDYSERRVNIYAAGNINFLGDGQVYADCWLTYGHDVYTGSATWVGEKHYTMPLDIVDDDFPDDPYDAVDFIGSSDPQVPYNLWVGNMDRHDINKNGGKLGNIHITGDLKIGSHAVVTLTGTVWVEGEIDIPSDCVITGEDSDGNPYFMKSEEGADAGDKKNGISIQDGSVHAILWAPYASINVAGNVELDGSVIGRDSIDVLGTANLQNDMELEEVTFDVNPVDILSWKIY